MVKQSSSFYGPLAGPGPRGSCPGYPPLSAVLIIGNLTCFSHNGASCVDYALASESLFDKISLFYVSEQSSLSDHCKITAHLPNKKIINNAEANYDWTQLKNRFVWSTTSTSTPSFLAVCWLYGSCIVPRETFFRLPDFQRFSAIFFYNKTA